MTIKLRLFLFYVNHFVKLTDISKEPHEIRAYNHARLDKVSKVIDVERVIMHDVEDIMIPVRDGSDIPARIYRPTAEVGLPLIVFYHGGGFVMRSIESHDNACRRIALASNSVVISVGYRLAPEFKFPIPVYDAYDAFVWAAHNADRLQVDADRVTVMGDSAGGNLATVTALLARDNGGPGIHRQVLIYPTVDARLGYPSIDKFGDGYFLTRKRMEWFVDHYKRNDDDRLNPMMSPILHEDHTVLPPAYIATACYDPLVDEGEDYANTLRSAGNDVIYKEYKNAIHGVLNMPRIMKASQEMVEDIAEFLRT